MCPLPFACPATPQHRYASTGFASAFGISWTGVRSATTWLAALSWASSIRCVVLCIAVNFYYFEPYCIVTCRFIFAWQF